MPKYKILSFFLLPVLVSFVLHFRVLKLDVMGYHVWRQAQTQTVVWHFSNDDNNILHPQKFDLRDGSTKLLYEFPLYQWMIAQLNRATHYSVANSRIFSFLIFLIFLSGFFLFIRLFVSTEIALIANTLLCFSPLLYYYCVNPLPDLMALAAATWALFFYFSFLKKEKFRDFLMFCLLIAVATLVKLPYIIFSAVFLYDACLNLRSKKFLLFFKKAGVLFLALLPAAAWYIHVIPTWNNNPVLKGIAGNEKSFLQLLDYFQFTFISSFPELLTNYASCIFLFAGIIVFFKNFKKLIGRFPHFLVLTLALLTYYFFEMSAIEKTHDYYLMPFIPLIFLTVCLGLLFFQRTKFKWLIYLAVVLVPVTAWLRIDHRWNRENPGFVADYLNQQTVFQKIIPADSKCVVDYDDSHFISLYYLKRYGYSLYKNEITPALLEAFYGQGAKYLVTENLSFHPGEYSSFDFTELYTGEVKIFKIVHR